MAKGQFWAGVDPKNPDNVTADWTGFRFNIYGNRKDAEDLHDVVRPVTITFTGAARRGKKKPLAPARRSA